jgi:hypothetical protein
VEFRRRLPAYLGGDLDEPLLGRMAEHEAACADCRREAVARMARDVPSSETAADPAFTLAILKKTMHPAPGVLDVLRAFWRQPEFLWEASLALALVFSLIPGRLPPALGQGARTVVPIQAGVRGLVVTLRCGTGLADQGWESLRAGPVQRVGNLCSRARAWSVRSAIEAERLEEDLRTGGGARARLLRELLRPVGQDRRRPAAEAGDERTCHE